MIRNRVGILAAIVTLVTIASSAPSQAQQETTKDQLLGTWRLLSFKAMTGDKVSYPLGEHPGGLAGVTPSRMWIMLVDLDRKSPQAAAFTDAEAVALMRSHASYTGKYDADRAQTPDGIKVVIHVDTASNQALVGTDRPFFMRVEGNKLTVKSPAVVLATGGSTSCVQLDYVKAD
jgi:lipocalin-like protein